MSKTIILLSVAISIIISVFAMPRPIQAQVPDSPRLRWKIGDSWGVRTWCTIVTRYGDSKRKNAYIIKGTPVDAFFKVSDIKSTAVFKIPYMPTDLHERFKKKYKSMPKEGYKCFEIELVFPKEEAGFQRRYLLYYRRDIGNLIRVLDNSIRRDGSVKESVTDFPIDPNGPIIIEHIPSPIPFDFPDFTKGGDFSKQEILDKEGKDERLISQKIRHGLLKAPDGTEYEGDEITMTIKKENKEEKKEEIKSIQKWRKGDPWWSEMAKFKDGEILAEAVLIRPTNKSK